MFTGFTLGVLAAFFWSITNVIDKHLVSEYAPNGNIGGVLLLSCFFPLVLAVLACIIAFNEIYQTPIIPAVILTGSGSLMVMWLYFYLKALTEDDASVVMTILVLAPFFSLILGYLILGETLSNTELLSGSLIIIGAITVTYQPASTSLNKKLLLYALGACVTVAIIQSIFKLYTVEEVFWASLFWRSLGMTLSGVLLFVTVRQFRKGFILFIKNHIKHGLTLNSANETMTLVGDTVFAFAILFAPIALVQSTESYQPIFVIILSFVLAKIGIIGFSSTLEPKQKLWRVVGILIVFLGGILLSLG